MPPMPAKPQVRPLAAYQGSQAVHDKPGNREEDVPPCAGRIARPILIAGGPRAVALLLAG